MANNISIDYIPNQRLYVVIRNAEGQVWHNKRNRWEEWKEEDIKYYCVNFQDKGGDRYVVSVPKLLRTKKLDIQIFKMTGRKPDNRLDNLVASNRTELEIQEYPKKYRGHEPAPDYYKKT